MGEDHPYAVMDAEGLRCLDYARHDRRPERSRGISLLLIFSPRRKARKEDSAWVKPTPKNLLPLLCALAALRENPPGPLREEAFSPRRKVRKEDFWRTSRRGAEAQGRSGVGERPLAGQARSFPEFHIRIFRYRFRCRSRRRFCERLSFPLCVACASARGKSTGYS